MMGMSRASLAELEERFNGIAGSADLTELADGLFAVVSLLDREHRLRRTFTDLSATAERKAATVRTLLSGRVSEAVLETVVAAVGAKWSRAGDLPDALERFGVIAALAQAEAQGQLDDVEDELFRFGRVVDGNPNLRRALADAAAPVEARLALVDQLLSGKTAPATLQLVRQLVAHPRGRSLDRGLEEFGRLAALQRRRLVAVVRTAVPLTDGQKQRLTAWLRASYGHDVHLNVDLDPQVLGGFSVRVGDEIIDTTVAGRLEEVRRRLAG
nr:F0F1 ATP synthase subunit delta [Rhizohabitans arisaemae]